MIIRSEDTKINQTKTKMMNAIPPVENVYGAKGKTYAESPFEEFLLYELPYKKHAIPHKKQERKEKEDNELVKKVNASLGIGTRLDLAA
jgi:hypothetical protein